MALYYRETGQTKNHNEVEMVLKKFRSVPLLISLVPGSSSRLRSHITKIADFRRLWESSTFNFITEKSHFRII